ncbi:MAG: phenylacetate--CoA ligase family protein [Thiohalocapsa sp.]
MTELYTRAARSVIFPLHELFKGHRTVAVHRELERTQWLSPAELHDYQCGRLQRFIADVYGKVPYYRCLFDHHGIDPRDISDAGKLQCLPLLDKPTIRAHTDSLKAADAANLARFNTGGSSGEPLVFYIGKERVSHDVAAKWRATRWWDVDIGDREIVVWGSLIELGAQDRIRMLRDKLLRTRLLPAFEFSPQNLTRFVDEIQGFRPRMLFGYPSSLALIARHAESMGRPLSALGISVAFVTSERLYDDQQVDIERVFGCRVANGYGGRDAGFIAHACPEGNLHITNEDVIVEIVDAQGINLPAGEPGEIVVTHLATRDFPFIRYRTGDIGAVGRAGCSCGRGLSLLERLDGRTTDLVVARDGTVMHGLALIYVLREIPAIDQFKIVQESIDRTRILIKPSAPIDDPTANAIVAQFQRRLGATVSIIIERVDEIPRERSGKFRYVVSELGSDRCARNSAAD